MDKPTKAQVTEFWEKCGFKYLPRGSHDKFHQLEAIRYPDLTIHSVEPPVDLNNLFLYAVPKLFEVLDIDVQAQPLLIAWIKRVVWEEDIDPALALFWAIYKVLKEANDA